jgi:predicted dehydrogenase
VIKALVIGYGSIGDRHTKLLYQMGCDVAVLSNRNVEYENKYTSLQDALATHKPDYIVIANNTTDHKTTLVHLDEFGYKGKLLIEKPLWSLNETVFIPNNNQVFVGFNLRFHPVLLKLKQILLEQELLSVDIHCGSYLPQWRPGRDYRRTSSALKSAGGGVLMDLSHELDYVIWIFGQWLRMTSLGGKISKLEIETDDIYVIVLETEKCPVVTIHLNYFEHRERRLINVNTESNTYEADLVNSSLKDYVKKEQYEFDNNNVINNTYEEQHLNIINGEYSNCCDFNSGLNVMDMMNNIASSSGNKWVNR